jgi:hypothetical protein
VALRELLPPGQGDATFRPVTSRREARRPRHRRTGPIIAAGVVLLAAAGGSAAVLRTGTHAGGEVAYPGGSRSTGTTGSPGKIVISGSAPTQAGAPTGVSVSRGGTAATPLPSAKPYVGASWLALTYTLQATKGGTGPAPFPVAVPGYRLANTWAARATITADRHFSAVGGLPVRTANWQQCRTQRFFVRWLAEDPKAVLDASFVDAGVRTVQNVPVHGAGGWMSSYGCVQPALRIRPGVGPASAKVIVQVQVWNHG